MCVLISSTKKQSTRNRVERKTTYPPMEVMTIGPTPLNCKGYLEVESKDDVPTMDSVRSARIYTPLACQKLYLPVNEFWQLSPGPRHMKGIFKSSVCFEVLPKWCSLTKVNHKLTHRRTFFLMSL